MRETLYAQVARDLAEGMASGRFPIGSLLPTEMELCERYGVSRHTVRAAMRELLDLELVSRHKRGGTRVEAARPAAGYNHSLATIEDLIHLAKTHVRDVRRIADVVADRQLAKELDVPPGTRWLRISSLRLDGSNTAAPICWTDTYVDAAYSDLRKVIRRSPKVLISTLIETRYGRRSSEVHQSIRATSVPPALAGELHAPVNSPALKIVRRYVDRSGNPFEISVSIHPADRFTFSMILKRDRGAG